MDSSQLPKKDRILLKISLFFIFTLINSLFYINVNAADGCYVGGVLYTGHTPKSGAYFYRTSGNITADCGVTGTISGSCRLYNSGNTNNNSSYTQYSNSYSTSISVVVCPIDDYVWLLMLVVAGFSFFKFRSSLKLEVVLPER
ncbi:MAG: hypothetical protein V4663_10520 [Bacteroidota bacterium]